MEVLAGPTFTIDVSSSSPATSTPEQLDSHAGVCQIGSDGGLNMGYGIGEQHKLTFQVEDSSENSSSSIGVPDDSENEESGTDAEKDEDEEVQSKFRAGLGSFDSWEDFLPIKRGLSNHFSGKSKSFADLSQVRQVNEVKELQKAENPFNKRRRLLIANKLARKSFYSWSNPKSMPLLTLDEDEEEEEDEKAKPDSSSPSLLQSPSLSSSSSSLEEKRQEDGEKQQLLKEDRLVESYHAKMRLRLRSFNKRGCFSLADLSEHDVHD